MLFSFQICLPWIWLDGIFFSFPCNEKCFIPFTFSSTLVSMVWVDYILVGNDKCLIGRKLCRMMHKVINVYGFMPKVEVLSKKKNPNFFPQHSEFDKCIRLCPTCMLEEWEKKMTLWILQTFLFILFSILLPNKTSLNQKNNSKDHLRYLCCSQDHRRSGRRKDGVGLEAIK